MSDLFSHAGVEPAPDPARPLADRLRPRRLEEVAGQGHLVGPEGALTRLIAGGGPGSLVLWGPPGTGKTTVARLLAERARLDLVAASAIFTGVAELRKLFDEARARRARGRGTLLFVDEIHRFNRAQQDGFLPVMEDGTVTLVGATTENPSFALNGALLSRARVLVFRALDSEALEALLRRAEEAEGRALPLDAGARAALLGMADGDGRALLNLAEDVWRAAPPGAALDGAGLARAVQRRAPQYDRAGDGHYNLISALHKAVRGSDPDAALYYLARMLEGGEDRLFIARRLVRMAVEDVGLADPQALAVAMAARDAFAFLGSPEGELALSQAAVYLSTAPKSNGVYAAHKAAAALARRHGSVPPPKAILNAPTALMKREGYAEGYRYDHDEPDAFSGQDYWPEAVGRHKLYAPSERGFEREVGRRLAWWEARRGERGG